MYTADKARENTNTELDDIIRDLVQNAGDKRRIRSTFYAGTWSFTPLQAVNGLIERGFDVELIEVSDQAIMLTFSW